MTKDEQIDLVIHIARQKIALLQCQQRLLAACEELGPLMPGYCDECGGRDCCDWGCQCVRMAVAYDLESLNHPGWEAP